MLNILNRYGVNRANAVGMRGDMPRNLSGGLNGLADSQATTGDG